MKLASLFDGSGGMDDRNRKIPGFSRYTINTLGQVHNGLKYMQYTIKRGQPTIRLYRDDGRRMECRVHKLMELTYMDPAPGKVLYRKNGDKLDVSLHNLVQIERKALGKITGAKSRRQPVAKLLADGELIEVYSSAREAARKNHFSYQAIIDRCNGKVKKRIAPDGYVYAWDE